MPPIWLNTNSEESSTASEKIWVLYWPVCRAEKWAAGAQRGVSVRADGWQQQRWTESGGRSGHCCAPGRMHQCPPCPAAPGSTWSRRGRGAPLGRTTSTGLRSGWWLGGCGACGEPPSTQPATDSCPWEATCAAAHADGCCSRGDRGCRPAEAARHRNAPFVQGRWVGATSKPPERPSSWLRMKDLPCSTKGGKGEQLLSGQAAGSRLRKHKLWRPLRSPRRRRRRLCTAACASPGAPCRTRPPRRPGCASS